MIRRLAEVGQRASGRYAPGLLVLPVAALFACLFVALAILLRFSFGPDSSVDPQGYSLNQYRELLSGYNRVALTNSLTIAAWVTGLSLLLAYPLALQLLRSRRRGLLITALLIPVLLDVVVRSYGWVMLLGPSGPVHAAIEATGLQPPDLVFNKAAIVIALLNELLPFTVIPIFISLRAIDGGVIEAAALLGASSRRVFWSVLVPLSAPGLIAGGVLVFALAFSALAVPLLLGGQRVPTVALVIQNQMIGLFNFPFGAAMAVLVAVGMVAGILVFQRLVTRVFFPHHAL